MKTYRIRMTRTIIGQVKVIAKNKKEALKLASYEDIQHDDNNDGDEPWEPDENSVVEVD